MMPQTGGVIVGKKQTGTVRIIGGKWRGTRLPVPDLPGLRPSGDRGRETLFNWLQLHIRGATCADLFAGSGVLGLEAASRGASKVILVEKSKAVAGEIQSSLKRLEADQVELIHQDAVNWLARCGPLSLDIVFIDPPFGQGLEARAFDLLVEGNCLRDGGMVYIETARDAAVSIPGPGWEIAKELVMGEVRIHLLKKV
jgi:16S rRNA (guanine966-N2)-methyltransferase